MRTEHFENYEFACGCCGLVIENSELKLLLELVRLKFGEKAVFINSGTRCEKHNESEGGAKGSKHLLGEAADIRINGVKPIEVYNYLDQLFPDYYGVAAYANFTHVDVSPRKWRQVNE